MALRDEIARAIDDCHLAANQRDMVFADGDECADAVLRVVGERLLSDEAVEAAVNGYLRDQRSGASHVGGTEAALSAPWRVVTGTVSGADEGNTP